MGEVRNLASETEGPKKGFMLQLYTSPDFIGHHPNFPVTGSHPTGGINTKMAAIAAALDCEVLTDIRDATANLIVEPLAIKAPRNVPEELEQGGDWNKLRALEKQRINELQTYPHPKILLCSELELLRWTGDMQSDVLDAVNGKVYASCRYQQRLFQMVGITSEIVYEPISEFLFFPGIKRKKQVVAAGSVKHIKNAEMIIKVFRSLEGKGYHRVYVGAPNVWTGKVHRRHEVEYDMSLYHELQTVCDEFHEASSMARVAHILSASQFYINFAYHEVCCRTAMEALMSGVGLICGEHPLWEEYPTLETISSAEACVAALEEYVDDETIPARMRQWASERFSLKRFKIQMKEIFDAYAR